MTRKVRGCDDRGEEYIVMGDLNSAINEEFSKGTYTAKKVLAWEAEEKVIIPNDKTIPTRVNPKKGEKSNTLNLSIMTPKL